MSEPTYADGWDVSAVWLEAYLSWLSQIRLHAIMVDGSNNTESALCRP